MACQTPAAGKNRHAARKQPPPPSPRRDVPHSPTHGHRGGPRQLRWRPHDLGPELAQTPTPTTRRIRPVFSRLFASRPPRGGRAGAPRRPAPALPAPRCRARRHGCRRPWIKPERTLDEPQRRMQRGQHSYQGQTTTSQLAPARPPPPASAAVCNLRSRVARRPGWYVQGWRAAFQAQIWDGDQRLPRPGPGTPHARKTVAPPGPGTPPPRFLRLTQRVTTPPARQAAVHAVHAVTRLARASSSPCTP